MERMPTDDGRASHRVDGLKDNDYRALSQA